MFKKYEYQRKKSPLSENINSVGSTAVMKEDFNGNPKSNGVFVECKDGGFTNSSPITIDSSSDSDGDDISELLKSVIHDHSVDFSDSKSKKHNQVYKSTSSSSTNAHKVSVKNCSNQMTGEVDEKVDGREMRKDTFESLREGLPNASNELIENATQEGENSNEAGSIVSESMKAVSENDKGEDYFQCVLILKCILKI